MTMVRFERENFKAKEELLHNEKESSIKTMREEEGEGKGEEEAHILHRAICCIP